MVKDSIDNDLLMKFNENYKNNTYNKEDISTIRTYGLLYTFGNNEYIKDEVFEFNIELPEIHIYNQHQTDKCWIYASLSLIQRDIMKNMKISGTDFMLSANYLNFFDKLEKSNYIYEKVITEKDYNIKDEYFKGYISSPMTETGYFQYVRALINKYGVVPSFLMPETSCGNYSYELNVFMNEKVKKDILILLDMKNSNATEEELRVEKEKMLNKNYSILCACLGQPVYKFDYKYKNDDGEYVRLKNFTPKDFTNKFLTINLDDLVGVANVPKFNKPFYRKYKRKYSENIIGLCNMEFINLPIERLQELALAQIKENVPVIVGGELKKMVSKYYGVMNSQLYNHFDFFDVERLTKRESNDLKDIEYRHDMLITGVQVENDIPVRWKVVDSYGEKNHHNGFYSMDNEFFKDFVFYIVVNKKYLKEEEKEIFNQEPLPVEVFESF